MEELVALLLREQSRLRVQSQELREQISAAKGELKEVEERLVHVQGLLGPNHVSGNDSEERPLPESRDISLPDSREIEAIAVDILSERNREPMHYRELAKAIQAQGGSIPGVDKDHTLIARLVRDDRFVRPTRRGFYALRKDYPDAKSVGARKPRTNNEVGSEQKTLSESFDSPK
ncbi:MAG: hypothetical protein OXF54_08010 [Caldilineaceae bacterium]|nr:hypothetical protein [Caldilineaceae bacterium]